MPQLWKTGRPTTSASGSSAQGSLSNPPAKGFFICPPKLVLGEGEAPSSNNTTATTTSNGLFSFPSSPPSSPTSPTSHQHPPKYDQLLNELRRAQVILPAVHNRTRMEFDYQPVSGREREYHLRINDGQKKRLGADQKNKKRFSCTDGPEKLVEGGKKRHLCLDVALYSSQKNFFLFLFHSC